MKSKEKSLGGDNRSGGIHKPKGVPVAEGSRQTRAPGAVMRGGPESPFPMANTGSQQSDLGSNQRGGIGGSQGGGWSARQRGQRMQAQAEQDRLGEVQQSGQGGIEQYQHSGSQQSDSGHGGAKGLQGRPDLPASDFGSKRNKKNPGS
ncbi:hypothetical protein [Massilia sp. 9I]|uniref:hypothetical protein n=1 Tax=Massilia sp. 9I TaxID=2653152 RepID=UPI0012F2A9B7|nr:hypothetical protein [Massilia sp. 9I]VXB56387.1 conserved hypothetical protein [Massilia sp. 9I]